VAGTNTRQARAVAERVTDRVRRCLEAFGALPDRVNSASRKHGERSGSGGGDAVRTHGHMSKQNYRSSGGGVWRRARRVLGLAAGHPALAARLCGVARHRGRIGWGRRRWL